MTADEFLGDAPTATMPTAEEFLGSDQYPKSAMTGAEEMQAGREFAQKYPFAEEFAKKVSDLVPKTPGQGVRFVAGLTPLTGGIEGIKQGYDLATGVPAEQAVPGIEGFKQLEEIKQQYGGDSPEYQRAAGAIAGEIIPQMLMAAGAAKSGDIGKVDRISTTPVQTIEKPHIQTPEIPAEDVAAMEQRAAAVQQYGGISPETGQPLTIDIPTAEQYLAAPETLPTVTAGEPSPKVGPTAGIPESPEATTPGDIAAGQQPIEPPRTVGVGQPEPQGIVAPLGERTGTSKIGQSIEAKAVEAKLTQGFPEIAGYDPITIRDQAQRATSFIESSPTDARAVIRGEASLPEGLRGTSLITAMEEDLLRKPDPQVAYELANSPLTSATSAAAQEMRLMSERVPDSITAKFTEIQEARRAGSKLRGETPERVFNEVRQEIVKQSSKRPTWESFVREITC